MLIAVFAVLAVAVADPSAAASPVAAPPAAAAPVASPLPCPSQKPAAAPAPTPASATPAPCSSAPPAPAEIGRVRVDGRRENLLGVAFAASQGTVSQQQLAQRPIYRPGEVLETIPGVVISQHSGEGKANQYYLRGFNLDHGTDIASSIVGVPINEPTHAHGQGYSDINWLLPELVSYVEYKKGPYYADEGDFATAGSYHLFYRDTIPGTLSIGGGNYGYGRLFIAGSPKLAAGNLLYAGEIYHDDAYFNRPDNYRRFNGALRYSRTIGDTTYDITGMGYEGRWNSSDQIPARAVQGGVIDRYGSIDPSDGGTTHRYALSTQIENHHGNTTTRLGAYAVDYYLDLFSNFTYFNDDAIDYFNVTANPITCNAVYSTCLPNPANHVSSYTATCPAHRAPAGSTGSIVPAPYAFECGDQREQFDKRFTAGFRFSRTWDTPVAQNVFGIQVRNDNIIGSGLNLDVARNRAYTVVDDHILQRSYTAFFQTQQRFTSKFKMVAGVRADLFHFDVHANADPANSGIANAGIVSPKVTFAYRISPHTEVYINAGESFHSNDGRGVTQRADPYTHTTIDAAGAPVQRVTPLARAIGQELGFRFTNKRWNSTVSAYQLYISSELTFSGDAGTTSAGRPTYRNGIEFANFYTPTRNLTLDADYAYASAKFLGDDPLVPIGTHVPGALEGVASVGVTADMPGSFASLRMRYFGPRPLIEDNSARSKASTLFNAQFGIKSHNGYRLAFDVFNILGAKTSDIDYFYPSWLPSDLGRSGGNATVNPALGGTGVSDTHFHPAEKQTFRLTLSRAL